MNMRLGNKMQDLAMVLFVLVFLLGLSSCPSTSDGGQEEQSLAETAVDTGEASEATGLVIVELAVDGMSCTGCEDAIKAELHALPGVIHVDADHVAGSTSVKYDPRKVKPEDMIAVMEPLGYNAVVELIRDA